MSKKILINGKKCTFYDCKDCTPAFKKKGSLRPNGKFCDPDCMQFVLNHKKDDGPIPSKLKHLGGICDTDNPEYFDYKSIAVLKKRIASLENEIIKINKTLYSLKS